MSTPLSVQIPPDPWAFMGVLPPSETAVGQVNCLRTPTTKGPEASVVFAGRWDTKDGIGKVKR